MKPTDDGLVRFFTGRKANVLYAAMPAYGALLTGLLIFFGIDLDYYTMSANPAILLFVTVALSAYIARMEVGVLFAIFLVAASNLTSWIPMARYVAIPLLDRVFCEKRQGS